jgi:hypothetical protein
VLSGNERIFPCAMTLDDFASFQPPYQPSPAQALRFRNPRVACGVTVCLGLLLAAAERHHFVTPLPILAETLIAGLTLAAGFALVRYQRILARTRSEELAQYQDEVEQRFKFTHCPNDRQVEVSERGFALICRCRRVEHLWSELVSVGENDLVFFLRTRNDIHVVSKRGILECRRLAEFRALLHSHVTPVETSLTPAPTPAAALEHDWAHA